MMLWDRIPFPLLKTTAKWHRNSFIIQKIPATAKSCENKITFTISDNRITSVYVRSQDYGAGNISAVEKLGE